MYKMADLGELTVTVKLNIDADTGNMCLKLAEMYANQIGANVVVNKDSEGKLVLRYKGIGLPEGAR